MDASFPISSRIPLKSVFWVSEAEWGSESISPWNNKLSLSLINYYYILLQFPVIDHLVVTGKNESLFESHWYKFNIVSFMIQNIYFLVWIKVLLELKHESFTLELCNITSITKNSCKKKFFPWNRLRVLLELKHDSLTLEICIITGIT